MLLLLFVAYAIALTVALGRAGVRSSEDRKGDVGVRTRPTRVLIVGASGGTGRQLVAQALERGYEVTAFVRNPSKFQVKDSRLTVVKGDVLDERTVEEAMRGQDAVLCALGHKQFFRPTRILSQGTRNILRAMEKHSVRRIVCETSLGIGDTAGKMGLLYTLFVIPVVLPFYFWDKTRQEKAIEESKATWVIVRPGALTNGKRRGGYREAVDVGSYLLTVRISRADVAEFMLNQVEAEKWVGSAVAVSY